MISISPEAITAIMLGAVIIGVFTGFYLAIPIGASALVVGFLVKGSLTFDILYARLFDLVTSYNLLAIPLFVFMGCMLESSGVAEKMYDAFYVWMGSMRGGLAITTILLGTVLATCVGIIGASVAMLTLIALPNMVRKGYDKSLACGAVCAGGCLGILIPPSVMLVVYGDMTSVSVGKLFMGAFIPGLLLSGLYCLYILVRSYLEPSIAPATPPGEITRTPFWTKTLMLVKAVAPTLLLILAVLGVIFAGVAPPTEAAAVGALAATLLAVIYRKFTWSMLSETAITTMRLTSMILLIGGLSYAFVGVFLRLGGSEVMQKAIMGVPGGHWGIFAVVMVAFFILGFVLDWIGIMFIIAPIVAPLIPQLGFDPVWFGIMICVNLQTSFMTPPLAGAIFFLKGTAPPELNISMADIIKGVIPFVFLVLVGLALCIAFPELILWLPGLMIK